MNLEVELSEQEMEIYQAIRIQAVEKIESQDDGEGSEQEKRFQI